MVGGLVQQENIGFFDQSTRKAGAAELAAEHGDRFKVDPAALEPFRDGKAMAA